MDLVIGAVLVHGARAPHVITRAQLGLMKHQAVLVDVSIDQGGCFETSRPTTHSNPTYEVDGITHYCVTNMPGAVPITSTYALTNATMPYVLHLATAGRRGARSTENPGLKLGRQRRRRPGDLRAGGGGGRGAVRDVDEALGWRRRRPLRLVARVGGQRPARAPWTTPETRPASASRDISIPQTLMSRWRLDRA